MTDGYVERILQARVYDVARETPLEVAERLSKRLDNRIWLKREDLQPVFSFKLRGAYNRMSRLTPLERERGVVAASAGNHAQGVALAATRLRMSATIVMPTTTPRIKVDAVAELGGATIIHGDTYDEAYEHAVELARETGATFVHSFDDPDVIAGQGTIAVEIARQHPDPIDAIFVPVGGGGLCAGITAYFKQIRPETEVIGVEPEDAASLHASLSEGRRVRLDQVGIFADGAAVRQVGEEPFRLLQGRIDRVIKVNTDAICGAILDMFEDTRAIAEPAGALAVAGITQYVRKKGATGRTFVAIASGANMNFHRLRHISERAELGQQREAILGVTIPERPGSFRAFCECLGDVSITEFNYRYADPEAAHVFVGIELRRGDDERREVIARLRGGGHDVVDMSEDETAKLHARYMVGGRADGVQSERIFRFEFPERPGALRLFLEQMSQGWNFTLFHYRNHGAAVGRVLVGMQIPDGEIDVFRSALDALGYFYVEETENPAYRLFLRGG